MKWVCHWNLALKCDFLFLFQNKGHFSQLVGRSHCPQDFSLTLKLMLGQGLSFIKDASQGMERSEEWNQLELSAFVCSYSWMVACSFRVAVGSGLLWLQMPADIKVQDPKTRGRDRWVVSHHNLMEDLMFYKRGKGNQEKATGNFCYKWGKTLLDNISVLLSVDGHMQILVSKTILPWLGGGLQLQR